MSGRLDRSYGHLVRVVAMRELLLRVRYPLSTLGVFVPYLVLFPVLFVGGTTVGGTVFDESLSGIIVGYFLWVLSTMAFVDISQLVENETQWGTLERHFITPFGFGAVLVVKSVIKLLFSVVLSVLLLVFMLGVTGQSLWIDPLTIVPILGFGLASVLGTGFAASGFTVLYPRTSNWLTLFTVFLLGLVAAPATGIGWFRVLPLVQASDMLQRAMGAGVRIWEFSPRALATLVLVGVFYLGFGYILFYRCQHRARRLGVLGDH